jgi:hypothetical protein
MKQNTPRRATSMAEFGALMGQAFGPGGGSNAISRFRPRPSDVIISPFGKCGTTWLQQTFHTLRTRGDMDFDDISRVVPWIETASVLDIDLGEPQRAEPRGFKSHLSYYEVPKGAKYVVSLREPKDAMVSLYRFMEGWFLEPGAISISDFAQGRLANGGREPGYWQHLLSWWEQRDNPDVLLLSYEHMAAEPEMHVRKLAAFCGIALDDDLLSLALERSSFDYMLLHKDRFDDAMMRTLTEERCNLPPGSDSAKVRKGGVGGHKSEMPADLAATLDAIWTDVVTPKTGFADYASFEAEIRRRNAGL